MWREMFSELSLSRETGGTNAVGLGCLLYLRPFKPEDWSWAAPCSDSAWEMWLRDCRDL